MTSSEVSFEWQVPTRVVFGAGRLDEIGQEAAALGSRVAVFLDRTLAALPLAEDVLDPIRAHGGKVAVVVRIDGPPRLSDIRAAVDQIGQSSCDSVVAVGGGSTMDCAKVAALAATNPGLLRDSTFARSRVLDLDDNDQSRVRPGLPTLLVPSTAATGSELNTVAAVLHRGRRHLMVSGLLAASTALLDPQVSGTLTPRQLAEGGVETFARLVCPYLAPGRVMATTDLLSETLAARCLAVIDDVHAQPRDLDSRADLTWLVAVSATQLAGLGRPAWAHVLWYLQDCVARVAGTGKGPAMAALLPAYLTEISNGTALGARFGAASRFRTMSERLAPGLGGRPSDLISLLSARFAQWGMPTSLDELGLGPYELEQISALTHQEWATQGRLNGVSSEELAAFFQHAQNAPAERHEQPRITGFEQSISTPRRR